MPVELRLLEAFRRCAPPVGDPAEDAVRTRAMEMIYERVQRLATRVLGPDEPREDVASTVAIRLIQNGPRGTRPDDPYTTDEMVDAYLVKALRNGRIDAIRAQKPSLDDEDEARRPAAPWIDLERCLELERAREAIRGAVEQVFGAVLESVPEGTRTSILIRRDVAEGRNSFDGCIEELFGEVNPRTRNRFYQQQHRALLRLSQAVEEVVVARSLSDLEAGALRVVVSELKDADAGWPVSPEEA